MASLGSQHTGSSSLFNSQLQSQPGLDLAVSVVQDCHCRQNQSVLSDEVQLGLWLMNDTDLGFIKEKC